MTPSDTIANIWQRLGWPGRIATAALLGAVAIAANSGVAIVRAMTVPAATPLGDAKSEKARDEKYKQQFDTLIAHIDGRTVFFTPAAPRPPEVIADEPPVDTGPPPKPTYYGGPTLVGMINGVAWFDNGTKLKVGADPVHDLKVTRLLPPWEAVVEWKGVEFTVGLFKRDELIIPGRFTRASVPATKMATDDTPSLPKPLPAKPTTPTPTTTVESQGIVIGDGEITVIHEEGEAPPPPSEPPTAPTTENPPPPPSNPPPDDRSRP